MRMLILALLLTLMAEVHCFYHSYATCWSTGQSRTMPDGGRATRYDCSCGDSVWVRE